MGRGETECPGCGARGEDAEVIISRCDQTQAYDRSVRAVPDVMNGAIRGRVLACSGGEIDDSAIKGEVSGGDPIARLAPDRYPAVKASGCQRTLSVSGTEREMSQTVPRMNFIGTALLVIEVFLGVSAVTTGIGVLAGMIHLPFNWIDSLPYPLSDSTTLSLLLAAVVGGSCLGASVVLLRAPGFWAAYCSTFSALIVMAWMAVEADMLGPATWVEPTYGVLTALLAGLAFAYLWLQSDGDAIRA